MIYKNETNHKNLMAATKKSDWERILGEVNDYPNEAAFFVVNDEGRLRIFCRIPDYMISRHYDIAFLTVGDIKETIENMED